MLRALLLLVVGGTFLSCAITPAVYSLLEAHLTAVPWPYSRVFDRVALVVTCALVWRLRGHLRLGSLRPYYQHWRRRGEYPRLLLGLLLTCSTALLAVPFVVACGAMYWHPRHGWQEVLERAVTFLPAALLIGLVEESFFRVLIFGKLRELVALAPAALATSLIYAVLHFVSPDKGFVYPGWSPTIGFEYLAAVGGEFLQPTVGAGILGLMLIGLGLCFVLRFTDSLGLCIGMHAGWALAAKLVSRMAKRAPELHVRSSGAKRNFLATRPEAWGAILACLATLWILQRRRLAVRIEADAVPGRTGTLRG